MVEQIMFRKIIKQKDEILYILSLKIFALKRKSSNFLIDINAFELSYEIFFKRPLFFSKLFLLWRHFRVK